MEDVQNIDRLCELIFTLEDHILHSARARSRNALLMCGRGVMRQGKVNGWLGKVTIEIEVREYNSPSHSVHIFRFKYDVLAIRIFGKIEIERR